MTNVGQFGVTEAQLVSITIFTLTGIFGQSFWKITLLEILPSFLSTAISSTFLHFLLKMGIGSITTHYFAYFILLICTFETLRTFYQVRKLSPIKECLSLFIFLGTCSVWDYFPFFNDYVGIVSFTFGLLIALLICKIIISSVTKVVSF